MKNDTNALERYRCREDCRRHFDVNISPRVLDKNAGLSCVSQQSIFPRRVKCGRGIAEKREQGSVLAISSIIRRPPPPPPPALRGEHSGRATLRIWKPAGDCRFSRGLFWQSPGSVQKCLRRLQHLSERYAHWSIWSHRTNGLTYSSLGTHTNSPK
jgi:hypothetical protein